MKLLIITQKYDINDSNLGAFIDWWDKLAEKMEKVYVLALEKRSEPTKSNMEVLSMGKENGTGFFRKIFGFYYGLLKTIGKVDVILVHMIPKYVILSFPIAVIFRKPIYLWYTGVSANRDLRFAVYFCRKIFTAHEAAMRIDTSKRIITGHGIDTNLFQISNLSDKVESPRQSRDKSQISTVTILSVGRITPSKQPDFIIRAIADLIKSGYDLKLKIVGGVIQKYHQEYFEYLKRLAKDLKINEKVEFVGPVSHVEMPKYFEDANILINAVSFGGLDKVVLEAMASGVIPLTSNSAFLTVFPEGISQDLVFKLGDINDLRIKLKNVIGKKLYQDDGLRQNLRDVVVQKHNLDDLIPKLLRNMLSIKVLYFGNYDSGFALHRVLIEGLRQNGVTVLECRDNSPGLKKFVKLFFKHWKLRNDYDVMIVAFLGQIIMPFAKIITRKPIIFSATVSLYDANVRDRKITKSGTLGAYYYWFLDWFSMKLADVVFCGTEQDINYSSQEFHIKKEKFKRIFTGAEDNIFHPLSIRKSDGQFIVSFHGTFIPVQGVEYIVKAAKLLESQNIKFLIIGRGQEKNKALDLANQIAVKNVEFLDFMPKEQLILETAKADVCLGIFGDTPRTQRSIPLKVYECTAMKKPIITADTPAIRELFNERDMMLVKAADPQSLADGILKLKNNPDLLAKLASNGYNKFIKFATPQVLGGELKKIIMELIR